MQQPPSPLRRWWLPSLTAWLWLVFLAVLLTSAWRVAMVSADGDTCMHWACGEWMLQHRQLLDHDVFSHTRPGDPIISKEWLTQLLFAAAGRWDGFTGIATVAALIITTTFALLHRQLLRERNDLFISTGLVILAAWAAVTHWIARPHLLTLLLIVPWNAALRSERNTGWLLPALTALWVNLHGGYLVGFITLGCYWLGAAVAVIANRGTEEGHASQARVRQLTITGLLCALASLANPAGYQLHIHNLAFVRNKFFTGWLAEYASTNFHNSAFLGFLLLLLLLVLVLALLQPRRSPTDIILLSVWSYFALYSVRNIPIFAILAVPILAPTLSHALPEKWRRNWPATGGWPVVLVAAVAFILMVPRPTAMPADKFPVKAVKYIRDHPANFTGPMFNQYLWEIGRAHV